MSDLQNTHRILHGGSGDYCYISDKKIDGDEGSRLAQQAIADDGYLVHDAILDAQTLMKHTADQSRQFVDRAQSESKTTVAKARERGFKKGYDEGYPQGHSEGTEISLDERQPLVEELLQLSQRLTGYYGHNDKFEYLGDAFELAQRIISIQLAKNDDAYFSLYRKAALHISNVDKATLKAGPRGYAAAQANKSKFEGAIEGLCELNTKLEGNDDGLCVLETSLGNINASVGVQLDRAKKIILPSE